MFSPKVNRLGKKTTSDTKNKLSQKVKTDPDSNRKWYAKMAGGSFVEFFLGPETLPISPHV